MMPSQASAPHSPQVDLVVNAGLDRPAVVVDLTDLKALPGTSAIARIRASRRIIIGVFTEAVEDVGGDTLRFAEYVDIGLCPAGGADTGWLIPCNDPLADAARLVAAVERTPGAALTTSALLRLVERTDELSGLQAESFAYSMLLGGPEFNAWLRTARRPHPPSTPAHPLVEAHLSGDLLVVELNHPERRNAYSAALRDQLVDALSPALEEPAISRVLLRGRGPSFCAGGDLAEFGTSPNPVYADLTRSSAGAAWFLEALRPRLVVETHGPTVGAGVEFAGFGQHVVAAPGTTFRLPEVSMGLLPGAGGTVSLTRRIGRWRLLFLAITGDTIGVDQALSWGLVDAVAY